MFAKISAKACGQAHPSANAGCMTHFIKMHGLGNDFVVIDARETAIPAMTPAVARALGQITGQHDDIGGQCRQRVQQCGHKLGLFGAEMRVGQMGDADHGFTLSCASGMMIDRA